MSQPRNIWKENTEKITKLKKDKSEMEYILATDVGSTTTKARFFGKINGEWRFISSGEAPTTVEEPYEDVTMGVRNAVREIEEITGHLILEKDGSKIVVPFKDNRGVDLYCSTSSAGGGLQMMVSGVMGSMTAASANKAAIGAGSIVMDVLATSDLRPDHVKIQRINNLRPDMILVAGGTDGGTTKQVVEAAELIKAAEPRPRFGAGYELPILYAGNKDAIPLVSNLLEDDFAFTYVENLRPVLETENLEPARRAIHEMFMEHVMSHAPGYLKLMDWTDIDILPTPAGEGMAMQLIANVYKENVLGVGLGGATTNIYSIFNDRFVRSVSANLGMSYSVTNVLKETGVNNIIRWIPFQLDTTKLKNMLGNKMIRPTIIPQTLDMLILEHALAREALRLGLEHHKTIATRLKGIHIQRTIGDIFEQEIEESYIHMMDIDIIAGTGGLLSHAPRRQQSMLILTDAFQPEGVTKLFQDSVFMMPHLGVLSTVFAEAAWNIFDKDCLVRLGTVIAPVGNIKEGEDAIKIDIIQPNEEVKTHSFQFGEINLLPLKERKEVKAIIHPQGELDVGKGKGISLNTDLMGGEVGILIDTRGRPLELSVNTENRMKKLKNWYNSLKMYPEHYEKIG
jgi:uncharacterized protein (TIGR01319 family)